MNRSSSFIKSSQIINTSSSCALLVSHTTLTMLLVTLCLLSRNLMCLTYLLQRVKMSNHQEQDTVYVKLQAGSFVTRLCPRIQVLLTRFTTLVETVSNICLARSHAFTASTLVEIVFLNSIQYLFGKLTRLHSLVKVVYCGRDVRTVQHVGVSAR